MVLMGFCGILLTEEICLITSRSSTSLSFQFDVRIVRELAIFIKSFFMNIRAKETNWSSNNQWPTFQAPDHLDVYDVRGASQDAQLSITTMTGVINRQQPKVYLLSSVDAAFWLQEVFAQIPHDVSAATGNAALDALLSSYGSSIRGMIIYDPNCVDSINIATMMAGQQEGIVVSPAQAGALQGTPHQLPVIADLRIYGWKNRIQAYT